MTFSVVLNTFVQLFKGVPVTLTFIIFAWILGSSLSILVTAGRLSQHQWLRAILTVYVSFIRSVPIVLQLFLVYYGLPLVVKLSLGIDLSSVSKMLFCVITFTLYYGAYLSEILRPSYLTVSAEQRDAALSMGYTPLQADIHVLIPQTLSIAIPGLGNEIINLVHQSSILFVLGTVDLMGQADTIVSNDYTSSPLLTYFCAGLIYWAIVIILNLVLSFLEVRIDKFRDLPSERSLIR
ncbi:amino acid ABC transporter permease [Secundilactobacillus kimchicus]|uniref:ABC transporter permease n=1 Tax=Secundilactobacillus kimchicus JCM 15530 TaxID=1302272 RepID=A0A0R1HNU3_9LACO|nr:amino acid ABC transporter permease [Secundilactobacillus kimchicus]KRK47289.1 ABC transporter permease [Secundilactobacillus kimchicus JCM 15530]